MEIAKSAELLINYIHAPLGGIALLTGGLALIVKKGGLIHQKSGMIFFYSMLLSALSSLLISCLPYHENPFLFSIGLFSTYFLLSGYRSLNFKKKEFQLRIDRILAYVILLTGISMILYPILLYHQLNIVLTVFGVVGIVFGIRDLLLFKNINKLRKSWLKLHLGKMMGGYISAVSAFFVVNQILPGIWNWFVPGILGGGYITYWMMKLKKKNFK
jgi:uncharacterized membrane protein